MSHHLQKPGCASRKRADQGTTIPLGDARWHFADLHRAEHLQSFPGEFEQLLARRYYWVYFKNLNIWRFPALLCVRLVLAAVTREAASRQRISRWVCQTSRAAWWVFGWPQSLLWCAQVFGGAHTAHTMPLPGIESIWAHRQKRRVQTKWKFSLSPETWCEMSYCARISKCLLWNPGHGKGEMPSRSAALRGE